MIETSHARGLIVASFILSLVACSEESTEQAKPEGAAPATAEVVHTSESELLSRLHEVYEQLEARDFRPYLSLRSEVSGGEHLATLEDVLRLSETIGPRVAAVVLEDQLVSGAAPEALVARARPTLVATMSDDGTPELTPLAIRILGRLPRGSSQAALLDGHTNEGNATTREMLLAALGDNVDEAGLVSLQERFVTLSTCGEARHATFAVRRADDAQPTPTSRPWLSETASARVLTCADERAEAGESPDADLHALVAAHDQAPALTLIEEVLLAQVGQPLKLRALTMLKESGDMSAATALNASLKELAAQGLSAEVAEVINTLRGL